MREEEAVSEEEEERVDTHVPQYTCRGQRSIFREFSPSTLFEAGTLVSIVTVAKFCRLAGLRTSSPLPRPCLSEVTSTSSTGHWCGGLIQVVRLAQETLPPFHPCPQLCSYILNCWEEKDLALLKAGGSDASLSVWVKASLPQKTNWTERMNQGKSKTLQRGQLMWWNFFHSLVILFLLKRYNAFLEINKWSSTFE